MRIFLLSTVLYTSLLFGGDIKQSPIPVPTTEILKRDSNICQSEECLRDHLLNGQIFSFLSYADGELDTFALKEQKLFLSALFNVDKESNFDKKIEVALLIPDKMIGRYSSLVSKSVLSYLLTIKQPFRIKNFYIDREDKKSILKAYQNIAREKFKFVIAPMTEKGAKIVGEITPQIYTYFPTVHSSKVYKKDEFMFFGGIDYKKQIDELVKFLQKRGKIALFYDGSKKGKELNLIVLRKMANLKMNITSKNMVTNKTATFSNLFKEDNSTVGQSYFLNTTKVKSSILLAELTAFEQKPNVILSTQINYSPILLSMTQLNDRKNMLIANSISRKDNREIVDINSLFNNNIRYDWINYSSTLGIDYFYSIISGNSRQYKEPMIAHQIVYETRIMKPLLAKFIEVERFTEDSNSTIPIN
jgi:SRSO17 transposase